MQKLINYENFYKVLNLTMKVMCTLVIIQAAVSIAPVSLFCDDLFEIGRNTISNAQQQLVSICIALCPLSLIVVIIGIMLTHDDKKIGFLIKLGMTIFAATALMLVINSGAVIDTLQSWFGSTHTPSTPTTST